MRRFALAFALVLSLSALAHSQAKADWSFPRAGMRTKVLNDLTFFDLGNSFLGAKTLVDGAPTVLVVLPSNLDTLIDNVNRSESAAIPDRDSLMVALSVERAVVTPTSRPNVYLGAGNVKGQRMHFFKTANGVYIAGAIAQNRAFVVLLEAPDPGPLTDQ